MKYEFNKIRKESSLFLAWWSIVDFYIAAYFLEYRILWGVIYLIPCISIVVSTVYFMRQAENDKKINNLFHGLYNASLGVSFCVLSYALLKKHFQKDFYIFWLILTAVIVVVVLITVMFFFFRINAGYYRSVVAYKYTGIPIMVGFMTIILRPLYSLVSIFLAVGILSIIVAILVFVNSVNFILRGYYYHLLEKGIDGN